MSACLRTTVEERMKKKRQRRGDKKGDKEAAADNLDSEEAT